MPGQYAVQSLPQTSRVARNPQHAFQTRQRPFVITPFFIAPVLPGETLKNLLVQTRAVTDPIKNGLIGWWLEYYFFYVRLTDMVGVCTYAGTANTPRSTVYQKMMIDPSFNLTTSGLSAGTSQLPYYFQTTAAGDGQINYVFDCYRTVVEWYFRDAGEAWNTHSVTTGGGVQSLAKVNQNTWFDSVTLKSAMAAWGDVLVDTDTVTGITAGEIDVAMQRYEMLRMQGMTTQTWDEFLQTYGVHIPQQEIGKPELVRFIREWQYPSNTVEATTGIPSSAVSWSVRERADKDRYFKEPGFLFGVSVVRPKVYFQDQKGSATQMMNSVYTWMPGAVPDPEVALIKMPAGKGPVTIYAQEWWVDIRDLLIYGDQFVNFDVAGTGQNMVLLPTAANERRFTETLQDLASFFTDSADTSDLKKQYLRQDGVVSLTVLGRQVDTSPQYQIGV